MPRRVAALWSVLTMLSLITTCNGQHWMPQSLRKLLQVRQDHGLPSSSTSSDAAGASWPIPSHPHHLHQHHGGHRFMLSRQQRQRGISHYGSAERLRAALSRAIASKQLTVGVVGGSISAGTGAEDAPSWVDRLETYLKESYGKIAGVNVTVNNGAVPGTTSAYMSACVNLHVPRGADIIIIEYSVNDEYMAAPPMDNPVRRPYERLIRKLLALPSAPAVVLLHAYAWFKPDPAEGVYYSNAERDLSELASYYGLPSLSVKSCCYEAMLQGMPGFQVHAPREVNVQEYKGLAFYYDYIHPDGNTGHRVMAELLIALMQRGIADILHTPVTQSERRYIHQPLPPPMMRANHESLSDKCFVGDAFRAKAVLGTPRDWEWVNESQGLRPKWGYVSTQPGSVLEMLVNSTASSGEVDHLVLIQLAYLRSYEHMGKALVRCESGCTCEESVINGYHQQHTSLLHLHAVYVSQHESCVISVQVLDDTDVPEGEHKVKLAAVVVSEEAGQSMGIDNPAAVEHVHDISFRHVGFGHNEVFDIRNHI